MLDSFTPEWVEIRHKDNPLMRVRGLNLDDFSILIREYLPEFRRMTEQFGATRTELLAVVQNESLAMDALVKAPALAAAVIVQASDQPPETVSKIRTLPLGTQIAALQHIVRMTVEDIGGPKALAALLMKMTSIL